MSRVEVILWFTGIYKKDNKKVEKRKIWFFFNGVLSNRCEVIFIELHKVVYTLWSNF